MKHVRATFLVFAGLLVAASGIELACGSTTSSEDQDSGSGTKKDSGSEGSTPHHDGGPDSANTEGGDETGDNESGCVTLSCEDPSDAGCEALKARGFSCDVKDPLNTDPAHWCAIPGVTSFSYDTLGGVFITVGDAGYSFYSNGAGTGDIFGPDGGCLVGNVPSLDYCPPDLAECESDCCDGGICAGGTCPTDGG
jgi:hypothetical protein